MMIEVKLTWLNKNGKENTEIQGIGLARDNAEAIQKAIKFCLDDYNKDGTQVEKTIIKIEIEDVSKIKGIWNTANRCKRESLLTVVCGNGILGPENMDVLVEKDFDELNEETQVALNRFETIAKQINI